MICCCHCCCIWSDESLKPVSQVHTLTTCIGPPLLFLLPLPFPLFKFFADSITLMQVFGTIDQAKHVISIMDAEPEPLRCRRTDGRRWRCQLPVLPDQKYCQRHVNRGRLSSRKYVEVLKTFSNSKSKSTATTSVSLLKTSANLQSHAKTELNKASIKNQSMNIKKPSMENSSRPLQFDFSVKSVVQDGNGTALGVGASGNDHETAQPERCRRTDGRKWRCKKAVLPGMKYCVQHMHRGAKKVKNCQKLNPSLSFLAVAPYQQAGSDGNQPSDPKSSSDQKHVEVPKTFLNSKSKSTATTPPVSLLKTTPNLQSHAKTKHNKASIKNQSMDMKKHSMENSSRPLQFDVSVKSVVQDGNGTALGVGASGNDHETAQLERCRRTDGRKWRCKKAVLPGMKYCVQHMHRGAKKVKNGQKLPGMKYCVQHMHRGAKKVKNGQKLNPYLSYLAGAPYQQAGSDGNQPNDASSSSDATTISM